MTHIIIYKQINTNTMNKKLTKTEIKSLARKIVKEAIEINKKNNETVRASKVYLDQLNALQSSNPLEAIKKQFEKELKIKFGTNYSDEINFSISSNYKSALRKTENDISQKITELNNKYLKPVYFTDSGLLDIEDELILSQTTVSDVAILERTVLAKLT